jgi:hypothetical protein
LASVLEDLGPSKSVFATHDVLIWLLVACFVFSAVSWGDPRKPRYPFLECMPCVYQALTHRWPAARCANAHRPLRVAVVIVVVAVVVAAAVVVACRW